VQRSVQTIWSTVATFANEPETVGKFGHPYLGGKTMKFLVIRKPRVGTPLTPTSKSIREQKEGLNAVKQGTLYGVLAVAAGLPLPRLIPSND
jgi:hypothetical protein